MAELFQLYDEQGRPLIGQGGTKNDIFTKGLLHGAAHVWIWRRHKGDIEVLLQKRAASKRTWPNLYDISTAGHLDLGEPPLVAAIRETKEEIGLNIAENDLTLVGIVRERLTTQTQEIENDLSWVYTFEIKQNFTANLHAAEVEAIVWKKFSDFKVEVLSPKTAQLYVPHTRHYFELVLYGLESASNQLF